MPFRLAPVDQTALGNVQITIDPAGAAGVSTNFSAELQFPPKITKDSKSVNWEEKDVLAYEPLAFYRGAKARSITIDCEWVCGGQFPPSRIRNALTIAKAYMYPVTPGGNFTEFPIIVISQFYEIIPSTRSTWRLLDVSVNYSEEMVNINGEFFPLHTKLTMNCAAVTNVLGIADGDESAQDYSNLEDRPAVEWF